MPVVTRRRSPGRRKKLRRLVAPLVVGAVLMAGGDAMAATTLSGSVLLRGATGFPTPYGPDALPWILTNCDPSRASKDGTWTSIVPVPAPLRGGRAVFKASGEGGYRLQFWKPGSQGVPVCQGVGFQTPTGSNVSVTVPATAAWVSFAMFPLPPSQPRVPPAATTWSLTFS